MTPIFGPGWGNYALEGLVEITLPPPVSLWPQTPGWYFVGAAVLLLLLRRGWRALQRHRRNRYRREALAALDEIAQRHASGEVNALRELPPLLKATALAAEGSREAAALTGAAWQEKLEALAPGVTAPSAALLRSVAYGPLSSDTAQVRELIVCSRAWIREHECADA